MGLRSRSMDKLTAREIERYRKSLGADHVETLDDRSAQGPWGMLELAEEVRQRLRSRGGRPTMPEWDIKRPIPLRRSDWDVLSDVGRELGLSPAQVGALLIERGIRSLNRSIDGARRVKSRAK